jgi:hypothetical protein
VRQVLCEVRGVLARARTDFEHRARRDEPLPQYFEDRFLVALACL